MSKTRNSILTLALLCAAGCAAPSRVATLPGVGPVPSVSSRDSGEGFLQVYSARERVPINVSGEDFAWNNDFGRNDFLLGAAHTSYSIYGSDGQLVQEVRNTSGQDDAAPALVNLAAGSYQIKAEARDYNDVTLTVMVPVCVESGLITSVHLDGNWNSTEPVKEHQWVRLPNGSVVGWHCTDSEIAKYAANIRN